LTGADFEEFRKTLLNSSCATSASSSSSSSSSIITTSSNNISTADPWHSVQCAGDHDQILVPPVIPPALIRNNSSNARIAAATTTMDETNDDDNDSIGLDQTNDSETKNETIRGIADMPTSLPRRRDALLALGRVATARAQAVTASGVQHAIAIQNTLPPTVQALAALAAIHDEEHGRSQRQSSTCNITGDRVWYCVHCWRPGCPRMMNGHALHHWANYNDHALAVKLRSCEVWCYACERWLGIATIPLPTTQPSPSSSSSSMLTPAAAAAAAIATTLSTSPPTGNNGGASTKVTNSEPPNSILEQARVAAYMKPLQPYSLVWNHNTARQIDRRMWELDRDRLKAGEPWCLLSDNWENVSLDHTYL
jgi:hypothetical protein